MTRAASMPGRPVAFTLPPEAIEAIAERVAEILDARCLIQAPLSDSRWLTVREAADYIRAKPQRIYDLRSSGKLSRHGDGARALIDRRELDRLVEEGAR